MPKNNYLFDEFKPISSKEWKQQIQMDLKGADYNESLIWQSLEGIDVKPFYHADEYEYLEIPTPSDDFKICQTIFIDEPAIANKIALDALSNGVDSIQFIAKKSFDIDVLFQGFNNLNNSPSTFIKNLFLSPQFINELSKSDYNLSLQIQHDILGHFAQTGNWFYNEEKDFKTIEDLLNNQSNKIITSVDASVYQNAGANIIQQVAYALSHANHYLNAFREKTVSPFQFGFAIGSNYFFEIAKFRAFRYLWKELMEEYDLEIPIQIIAKPSNRNKTLYDYNVNMLRTTSEYMSAVLGGADIVTTHAYDSIFKKSNSFSNRIARNQLLILKEENAFNNAQNFAKGSYYIETITIEIAKKALELFKNIEKNGGFLERLKSGIIQKKIKEAAQKEQDLFDNGKLTLLGTNKYPNPENKIKDGTELYPFLKLNKEKTLVAPILPKRLAEKMEKERLSTEQ